MPTFKNIMETKFQKPITEITENEINSVLADEGYDVKTARDVVQGFNKYKRQLSRANRKAERKGTDNRSAFTFKEDTDFTSGIPSGYTTTDYKGQVRPGAGRTKGIGSNRGVFGNALNTGDDLSKFAGFLYNIGDDVTLPSGDGSVIDVDKTEQGLKDLEAAAKKFREPLDNTEGTVVEPTGGDAVAAKPTGSNVANMLRGKRSGIQNGIMQQKGDPWEYAKKGDNYLTRRIGTDPWITAKGDAAKAIANVFGDKTQGKVKTENVSTVDENGNLVDSAGTVIQNSPVVDSVQTPIVDTLLEAGFTPEDTAQAIIDSVDSPEELQAIADSLQTQGNVANAAHDGNIGEGEENDYTGAKVAVGALVAAAIAAGWKGNKTLVNKFLKRDKGNTPNTPNTPDGSVKGTNKVSTKPVKASSLIPNQGVSVGPTLSSGALNPSSEVYALENAKNELINKARNGTITQPEKQQLAMVYQRLNQLGSKGTTAPNFTGFTKKKGTTQPKAIIPKKKRDTRTFGDKNRKLPIKERKASMQKAYNSKKAEYDNMSPEEQKKHKTTMDGYTKRIETLNNAPSSTKVNKAVDNLVTFARKASFKDGGKLVKRYLNL